MHIHDFLSSQSFKNSSFTSFIFLLSNKTVPFLCHSWISPLVCRWHLWVPPSVHHYELQRSDLWKIHITLPTASTDYMFINRCSESPQIYLNWGHSWDLNPQNFLSFLQAFFMLCKDYLYFRVQLGSLNTLLYS